MANGNIISVTTEELQQCVTEYQAALGMLEESVKSYEAAVNALKIDWTGRAAAAMMVSVKLFSSKVKESFARVNDAINELRQVENLFTQNEEEITAAMNKQDVGKASPFGAK